MKLKDEEKYIEVRDIDRRKSYRCYLWSFMRNLSIEDHTHDQQFTLLFPTEDEAFPDHHQEESYESSSRPESSSLCTSDQENIG